MELFHTEIPVMFCFDNNYVIPAAVAFYSLLENADKNFFYKFYVLHSDITDKNKNKLQETIKEFSEFSTLEFIDMNHKFDNLWEKISTKGHFSKEVMYKVLVASIFPQYDKIIVSDVDVVFLGDISKSYFFIETTEDMYIAGVKGIGKIMHYMDNYKNAFTDDEIKILSTVCGGYLVFNLKKIREDNLEEKFINCFIENGNRINQMEQDILNLCCYPKIKLLPLNYVACSYMWDIYVCDKDFKEDSNYSEAKIKDAMNNTIQLHYATSIKPWKNVDCTKSEDWFKYIVKTPFLLQYLKELPNKIIVPEERIKTSSVEKIYRTVKNKAKIYLLLVKRILNYIKRNPLFFINLAFYKKVLFKIDRKTRRYNKKLIIIDDVFPSKKSTFRYEEYVSYLNYFNDTAVLLTGKCLEYVKEEKNIEELYEDIIFSNPQYSGKFFKNLSDVSDGGLAILTFLSNTYDSLDFLEENNIPFVFTLYPGGQFSINDEESDLKLKKIFTSNCFRKVIVNQKITYKYLIDNNFCSDKDIEYIYGGVVPNNMRYSLNKKRKFFGYGKDILDICFVAHKYSNQGSDKGYDSFIEVAHILSKEHDNIKFHVVGGFNENDINIEKIKDKVKFYNVMDPEELSRFYNNMDIILSPNKPFILSKGSFDGFPTGACTEAMLNKVALFCTDELKVNENFINHCDIEIIDLNADNSANRILEYYNNPKKLNILAKNGYKVAKRIYSFEYQMMPRIKLLKSELKREG